MWAIAQEARASAMHARGRGEGHGPAAAGPAGAAAYEPYDPFALPDLSGNSKSSEEAQNGEKKDEGKKAMVKVFKPVKKGDFKLAPKKGTKKYKTLIKKMG